MIEIKMITISMMEEIEEIDKVDKEVGTIIDKVVKTEMEEDKEVKEDQEVEEVGEAEEVALVMKDILTEEEIKILIKMDNKISTKIETMTIIIKEEIEIEIHKLIYK